jgi:hypothetical protein
VRSRATYFWGCCQPRADSGICSLATGVGVDMCSKLRTSQPASAGHRPSCIIQPPADSCHEYFSNPLTGWRYPGHEVAYFRITLLNISSLSG